MTFKEAAQPVSFPMLAEWELPERRVALPGFFCTPLPPAGSLSFLSSPGSAVQGCQQTAYEGEFLFPRGKNVYD